MWLKLRKREREEGVREGEKRWAGGWVGATGWHVKDTKTIESF